MGIPATRSVLGRGWTIAVLIAFGVGCTSFTARTLAAESENAAGSHSMFDSKFVVAFGGYFPYVDTTVRVGSSGSSGSDLDFEDDLGFEKDSASAWLSFNWRFAPRHQLHLEWFQLDRSGSSSTSIPLDVGGTIIASGKLDSKLDLDIGRITYGYSMIRDESHDLSFQAGLHIATAKATITMTGLISVNGTPFIGGQHTESTSSFTLPLPHLGLKYDYKFAPKWITSFSLLGFWLKLDEFSGYLIEANGAVIYEVTDSFGIGGALKYYKIDMENSSSSGNVRFDLQFVGPALFVYGSF
jgi:hypothetical protein